MQPCTPGLARTGNRIPSPQRPWAVGRGDPSRLGVVLPHTGAPAPDPRTLKAASPRHPGAVPPQARHATRSCQAVPCGELPVSGLPVRVHQEGSQGREGRGGRESLDTRGTGRFENCGEAGARTEPEACQTHAIAAPPHPGADHVTPASPARETLPPEGGERACSAHACVHSGACAGLR